MAISPPEVPRGEAAAEAAEVLRVPPLDRRDTHPPQVAEAATRIDGSIVVVLFVL